MTGIFRELLAGERLIRVFAFGRMLHPVGIEMLALAGDYDGFWLDQEHSGLSTEQISTAATAGRAAGLGCFVRLATVHYSLVNQALESGADGVMAARISSADDARQFVRWAKFAPRGMRGMNTSSADAKYTHLSSEEFALRANREQMVAVQIETAASVDDVDAIAAVDDVDLLFVGPSDLSQELGVLGQQHHDKVWEAIDRVAAACRRHGKAWGSVAVDARYAERAVERGCRLLTFGNDLTAVRLGLEAIKQQYATFFND